MWLDFGEIIKNHVGAWNAATMERTERQLLELLQQFGNPPKRPARVIPFPKP
jgi:hypothetical protein